MANTKESLFNAGRIIVPALIAGVAAAYTANLDLKPPDSEVSTAANLANVTSLAPKTESPIEINHAVIPGNKMPDGTVYAGRLPDTGRPIYTAPTDAAATMTFNEAAAYANELNREQYLGHDDWRVPTKNELNLLFKNRAAIGGFNETGSYPAGWYWSSSQGSSGGAWSQRFSGGSQNYGSEYLVLSLRCVR